MPKFGEMFQLETHRGEPVMAGDAEIIPQSQALTVRWPWGGFVWNRPVGVLIRRGGEEQRLPIVDVTRVALWALGAASILTFFILSIQHRRSSHE